MREKQFVKELSLIRDPRLLTYAKYMLQQLPEYFFHVAASSTGKYHPAYTLGDGGLVRHTKAAIQVAESLMQLKMFNIREEHDYIIVALLLHDGWKHGLTDVAGHTVFEHPRIAAEQVLQIRDNIIQQNEKEYIASLIITHMGQWTTCSYSQEVLPEPHTAAEQLVHLSDYIASRKNIEVKLD
jgi:hypothetical protein